MKTRVAVTAAVSAVLWAAVVAAPGAAGADQPATYRVTLTNLTGGQPFSPPAVATHRPGLRVFEVGALASDEIAAIAQDGNEAPLVSTLSADPRVTQVVDVGRPLTPHGVEKLGFTDSVTVEITARPGDRLSLATMLICTNDGFLGLAGAALPASGIVSYALNGYDAGREDNTERSADLVDPCSALGPVPLPGDPNGNEDAAVATSPREPIHHHPGITGTGDLSVADHGWTDPVATVTVTRTG